MVACNLIYEAEDLEQAAIELRTSALLVLGSLDPFAVARVRAGSTRPVDIMANNLIDGLCDDLWQQAGAIIRRCRALLDRSDWHAEHAIADGRTADVERSTSVCVAVTRAARITFDVQQVTLDCMNPDGAREHR